MFGRHLTDLHKMIIISAFVAAMCIILFPVYKFITFNISDRLGGDKCPFCFGRSMCPAINDSFKLSWDHFWTNLLNIFLNELLFFGTFGSQEVVLKGVHYDNNFKYHPPVDIMEMDLNTDIGLVRVLNSISHLPKFSQPYHRSIEDFVLCPTTERLSNFVQPILMGVENLKSDAKMELYKNLIYSLQASMEPIVQQVTQKWAVAPYLGACGDVIVSEYCGRSLTSVFSELTWNQRSSLTRQLLHMAFNATFDNPAFAFYFTDLSPDNLAVSDSFEIRLVDLDNVIVVDKDPSGKPPHWDTVHTSYHDEDIQGFSFSTEEICSHEISDTNVYAICQGILSTQSDLLPGGLLHSPPSTLSGLEKLVQDCISPPVRLTRFDVARSILQVLQVN